MVESWNTDNTQQRAHSQPHHSRIPKFQHSSKVAVKATMPESMPVHDVKSNSVVTAFSRYLEAECNASPHTLSGYVQDIGQLCAFVWPSLKALSRVDWPSVTHEQARAFLVASNRLGASPATTRR